jgi:hypothetical protein
VFNSKPNEPPYTIFSIFSKTRATKQIINAEVLVWERLKAKPDDYLAIYGIASVDFEEKDKGYQVYKTIKIVATSVQIIKEDL